MHPNRSGTPLERCASRICVVRVGDEPLPNRRRVTGGSGLESLLYVTASLTARPRIVALCGGSPRTRSIDVAVRHRHADARTTWCEGFIPLVLNERVHGYSCKCCCTQLQRHVSVRRLRLPEEQTLSDVQLDLSVGKPPRNTCQRVFGDVSVLSLVPSKRNVSTGLPEAYVLEARTNILSSDRTCEPPGVGRRLGVSSLGKVLVDGAHHRPQRNSLRVLEIWRVDSSVAQTPRITLTPSLSDNLARIAGQEWHLNGA